MWNYTPSLSNDKGGDTGANYRCKTPPRQYGGSHESNRLDYDRQ